MVNTLDWSVDSASVADPKAENPDSEADPSKVGVPGAGRLVSGVSGDFRFFENGSGGGGSTTWTSSSSMAELKGLLPNHRQLQQQQHDEVLEKMVLIRDTGQCELPAADLQTIWS